MLFLFSVLVVGSMAVLRVSAAPSGTITPTSGPSGTIVYASGSGFTPNGEVQATINGQLFGTKNADANGNVNVTVIVPNVAVGNYQIVVTDVTTGATVTAQFNVTPGSVTATAIATATATPTVPELPTIAITLTVFIAATLATLVFLRKSRK